MTDFIKCYHIYYDKVYKKQEELLFLNVSNIISISPAHVDGFNDVFNIAYADYNLLVESKDLTKRLLGPAKRTHYQRRQGHE